LYRKSKLFITALLGIALLAGVAGAEELWETGDFFALSVPVSTGIPILEFTFFVPGQVPAATAGQVPAVTPSSWSGIPEGFIAPVFTGAFASPFIGPDPITHPEAYEPIATGGSQASISAADVTDSWSDWFSKPTPSSCPL
jgi:hypothetical protein